MNSTSDQRVTRVKLTTCIRSRRYISRLTVPTLALLIIVMMQLQCAQRSREVACVLNRRHCAQDSHRRLT